MASHNGEVDPGWGPPGSEHPNNDGAYAQVNTGGSLDLGNVGNGVASDVLGTASHQAPQFPGTDSDPQFPGGGSNMSFQSPGSFLDPQLLGDGSNVAPTFDFEGVGTDLDIPPDFDFDADPNVPSYLQDGAPYQTPDIQDGTSQRSPHIAAYTQSPGPYMPPPIHGGASYQAPRTHGDISQQSSPTPNYPQSHGSYMPPHNHGSTSYQVPGIQGNNFYRAPSMLAPAQRPDFQMLSSVNGGASQQVPRAQGGVAQQASPTRGGARSQGSAPNTSGSASNWAGVTLNQGSGAPNLPSAPLPGTTLVGGRIPIAPIPPPNMNTEQWNSLVGVVATQPADIGSIPPTGMMQEEFNFQIESEANAGTRAASRRGNDFKDMLKTEPVRNIEAQFPKEMEKRRTTGGGADAMDSGHLKKRPSNVKSAIAYRRGKENKGEHACRECKEDFMKNTTTGTSRKLYCKCVSMGKIEGGACTNCMWSNQAPTCSLYKGVDKNGKSKKRKRNRDENVATGAVETDSGPPGDDDLEAHIGVPSKLSVEEIGFFYKNGWVKVKGVSPVRAREVASLLTGRNLYQLKTIVGNPNLSLRGEGEDWHRINSAFYNFHPAQELTSIKRKASQLMGKNRMYQPENTDDAKAWDKVWGAEAQINLRDETRSLDVNNVSLILESDLRTGLRCVILYTDVQRESGEYWSILPGVVQDAGLPLEHGHPLMTDGIQRLGNAIRASPNSAGPRVPLTGEAGDMYLIHPLMGVSSEKNILDPPRGPIMYTLGHFCLKADQQLTLMRALEDQSVVETHVRLARGLATL